MKILIVDDSPDLLAQVCQALGRERYDLETAEDGEAALDKLFDNPFDLVLLDIMLPKQDGLAVLKEMRAADIKTPVLMLTAKGDVEDRIRGLDLGADDYLAKPFSMGELLARVRALFRRFSDHRQPLLMAGPISLDTVTREVRNDRQHIDLTPKEFSILEFLLYNMDRAISRFSLAEHVWGDAFDPFTMSNSIDVHIKNLRRKLGDDGGRLIQTIRGVGYIVRSESA
ncbi:DNA-binding response regulator in two-component regulatory system with CpxA [Desulfosarcina cetonica]|uniref:response regulator transcription factor n=1 Tax=Desulfosarcina cetonica TaxID=90730 RepID=UPI00155DB241|nr:response regulator transcription factor [Desulfosarcina cetonica]VTR71480.1 DNA-binding response regulator in two-component regulatory system with CpxA [Desulfosarcina cetonica]